MQRVNSLLRRCLLYTSVVGILRDAFGHIREKVLLDLPIKLNNSVWSSRQVFRRQHPPRLKGSAVDSTGHMLFATSSVSLYPVSYTHLLTGVIGGLDA